MLQQNPSHSIRRHTLLLLTLGLSVVFMTLCSMASPLFPIHTGVDQNTFLTVGKAVLSGRVPYRDLFEQKGPLLYLLHVIAAALSPHSFTGVWLLELLSFWWYLILLTKIAVVLGAKATALPAAACTGCLTAVTYAFSKGNNAEEFCLPLVAAGLLLLLNFSESDIKKPPIGTMLACGVCAGCILWIKFTMLGFYIALVGCMFVLTLRRNSFTVACISVLCFLCGMGAATLPWLIYFAANGALLDFWEVYFYDNIFLYSGRMRIVERFSAIFSSDFRYNPLLFSITVLGLLFLRTKQPFSLKQESRLCLFITWLTLYIFLFAGGTRYRYYFLIMAVYALPGMVGIGLLLEQKKLVSAWLTPVCAGALCMLCVPFSNCRVEYFRPKADYPQYQFAALMGDSPALLNYRFLDGGFYLAADAPLPDTRFFCTVNIPKAKLPKMYDEQDEILENSAVEFVVTRYELDGRPNDKEPPCAALAAHYHVIADAIDPAVGYGYQLHQRLRDAE